MARFAEYLSLRLGRPVLDQTELNGAYTIALDWVPDSTDEPGSAGTSQPGAPDGGAGGPSGPSIFAALQEQLGLKLVATKGPMESSSSTTWKKLRLRIDVERRFCRGIT